MTSALEELRPTLLSLFLLIESFSHCARLPSSSPLPVAVSNNAVAISHDEHGDKDIFADGDRSQEDLGCQSRRARMNWTLRRGNGRKSVPCRELRDGWQHRQLRSTDRFLFLAATLWMAMARDYAVGFERVCALLRTGTTAAKIFRCRSMMRWLGCFTTATFIVIGGSIEERGSS